MLNLFVIFPDCFAVVDIEEYLIVKDSIALKSVSFYQDETFVQTAAKMILVPSAYILLGFRVSTLVEEMFRASGALLFALPKSRRVDFRSPLHLYFR